VFRQLLMCCHFSVRLCLLYISQCVVRICGLFSCSIKHYYCYYFSPLVVQSERVTKQGRVKSLYNDWQSLKTLRLSADMSVILRPRISKNSCAESFIGLKVSTVIGRNRYARKSQSTSDISWCQPFPPLLLLFKKFFLNLIPLGV